MNSIFHPESQHLRVDSKIVSAMERLNQAFRVLLWERAQRHGLSPIQIQILIFLLNHGTSFGRVGQLAREFGLTAATISDAVSALEDKKLLARLISRDDRRAINLKLTPAGKRLALKLDDWADVIRDAAGELSTRDQTAVLNSLMKIIETLRNENVISVARICLTCRYFDKNAHSSSTAPHHCNFFKRPMAATDLRVDCAEHESEH